MSTTQEKLDEKQALQTLGIDHHTYDMRLKFQECFVCGAPVNFLRLYTDRKKYCPLHESETGARKAAIEVLNRPKLSG